VWKAVQEQHARLLPASPPHEEKIEQEFAVSPLNELVAAAGPTNGLIFGTRLEREPLRRKPLIVEADCQLSLF
jgi:hypothetical protein